MLLLCSFEHQLSTSCSLVVVLCSSCHGCLLLCTSLKEASKEQKAVIKVRNAAWDIM
jgi:antirestriction protein